MTPQNKPRLHGDDPLVQGGQGRSGESLESDAWNIIIVVLVVFSIGCFVAAILLYFG